MTFLSFPQLLKALVVAVVIAVLGYLFYPHLGLDATIPVKRFLPNAWGHYRPTLVEFGIMIGSFCLFFFLFVLFVKHMPSVSMTEMKETLVQGENHDH